MANALYNKARQSFLEGQLSWATAVTKVIMVDTANYVFDAAHQFISSVPAVARITAPTLMIEKTTVDGAADAKDVTFTAVVGPTIEALVIYVEVLDVALAVDEAASTLLAYIDSATGLPITPNGGDIIVTWDNGVNKVFRL